MRQLLALFLICCSVCVPLSAKNYQYLLFYRNGFLPKEKEAVFDKAISAFGEKAESKKINIVAPEAKELIEKYDLRCAPMPFILVVGNNGAITGSFACDWSEEELKNAMVSPKMEETLKALEENKLVFLLISNPKAEAVEKPFQGVFDFVSDPKFSSAAATVHIDITSLSESALLKQFEVDLSSRENIVIFLAPPGDCVGKFKGNVTKEALLKALEAACSGCCPSGCCSGGCCNSKK